ncbi:MAG: lytic transglycosylase domain-containing protein [Pseudomonadota bacterium]
MRSNTGFNLSEYHLAKKKAATPQLMAREGQLRQNYGKCGTWFLVVALCNVSIPFESTASPLDNRVRVGDRSRMHIAPAPKAGQKVTLPSATTRVLGGRRPAAAPQGYKPGRHDWFWNLHATARGAASPLRWSQALATVSARRSTGSALISTATLDRVITEHGTRIAAAADRHAISAALVAAVIAVESAGRQRAVSHAGAQGLMQLMPATAERFGVTDSFDADQNVEAGVAYLSWLLNRFEQDPILALSGYNAGEGAVDKHKGVPPFAETRDYVVKVMDAVAAGSARCRRAPATPRHPCDFDLARLNAK